MKGLPNNSLEIILNELSSGEINGEEAKKKIAQYISSNKKRKETRRDDNSRNNADGYDSNVDADFAFAD